MGAERPRFWQVLPRETRASHARFGAARNRVSIVACEQAAWERPVPSARQAYFVPNSEACALPIAMITAGNASRADNRATDVRRDRRIIERVNSSSVTSRATFGNPFPSSSSSSPRDRVPHFIQRARCRCPTFAPAFWRPSRWPRGCLFL